MEGAALKDINLPSGAALKIGQTPFAESKALYQAILKEMKSIPFGNKSELASVIKDFYCVGFSSMEVESALKKCMSRCLYNNLKIDDSTFEPDSAREDYTTVCLRVMEENISPFLKGLSVELDRLLAMIPGAQT